MSNRKILHDAANQESATSYEANIIRTLEYCEGQNNMHKATCIGQREKKRLDPFPSRKLPYLAAVPIPCATTNIRSGGTPKLL